ncbi:MAG: hypothetical protein EZS28_008244 [Streblomastix strix]|uniref:Uncharacterized protein n=1 Tax=Streblomastix strix TaxID=222440 RepID=A0A5J4WMW8_9EUKA|nr:MAG: hypothetical protein EZS28_008244 [Streblomastix strix]
MRKKADIALFTENNSKKRSKGNRTKTGSKNRNMNSTPKTSQKQSPIPRLICRISWTEQERKEEGKDC